MSFALLRVPKKAALTVWSGLVVGTSCTLLLITEDRRRRINQARSAIQNADRIRSSKQYHATGPVLDDQLAAAIDGLEARISSTHPVTRRYRLRREYKDWNTTPEAAQTAQGQQAQDAVANKGEHVSAIFAVERKTEHDGADLGRDRPGSSSDTAFEQSSPKIRSLPAPHHWRVSYRDPLLSRRPLERPYQPGPRSRSSRSRPESPTLKSQNIKFDENLRCIERGADSGDQASLEQAVENMRNTLKEVDLTEEDKRSLAEAAIKLCLKCQQAGLMDQAMRALHSALELGPLAEAQYYEAEPQRVIDYAVSVAEVRIQEVKKKGMKSTKDERRLLRTRMDRTIMLVMPKLTEGTLSASRLPEWLPAVEKCMNLAFDLGNMMGMATCVFWRIERFGGDPDGRILLRFMERLHEAGRLSQIVNTFNLMRHKLVKLNADTWYAIGDLVADAVDNAPGQNPAKLLEHMVEFCPRENCLPLLPLRTTWTTKILYCHWTRKRDFGETLSLFQRFEELGGFDMVVHKDGMYRTMIQIALEAEQWQNLDQLLRKLLAVKPSAAKEARILGLLALAKARLGDWNAVWEDFKSMEHKDRIEDVFVPILHEFIKTHTTKEIEDFLKAYIEEIKMPISPYAVNIVANRYGDVRDIDSFLGWLSWCSSQGFEIDAAFGNAILINCRRRWDFDFEKLTHIYRTLQALNPNFVDDVTEKAMVSIGLTAHRNAKIPFLKKQVGFASRKFHRWTVAESAGDMRVDMRHAFSMRDYRKVLFLYRTAVHKKNIPLDDGHLRLAVQASLKLEKRAQPALKMIREAKEQDLDVSKAVTLVFLVQLRRVFIEGDTSNKDQLLREVQNCIARFEASGLSLGHQALLRVAFQMLRARHFSSAISFGLSALQQKGITYPDDIATFKLFLVAYGYRADVQGMKWTLTGAMHAQYYQKRAVYLALKDARNFLSKQIQSVDVKKTQRIVEEGIDRYLQQVSHRDEDRKLLQRQTLDIMKRAALEAEHQPTCEEAIKRREAVLAEIEENVRREEQEELRRLEARKAEMQARKKAAEEAQRMNQEEADAMEALLAASRHEVQGDF
ncbi:hypothetical protein N0V82_001641 [Gnomoniopsis sp. IMI 355080]|nr:hypothetical protein N0V82_001641 [Gnomoniopsis sp. IMI 355080]